ncbi:MAG: sulfite reductase subunit C [Mogibacterium sp.]|nr:sulfite reductase subunit C [Mogibacterium sp.]
MDPKTRDINKKKFKKYAFRYSKVRGETASRIRVPGGHISVENMERVLGIAEKYGNGTIHLSIRQGIEVPGISLQDLEAVKAELQPIIESMNINQDNPGEGYSASGTRNVMACIGKRVCPFGCYDTTALAQRIEKEIFPHDLHVKVALTGCSNDCGKVRMHDFGIIGQTEPQYNKDRCVTCGACVKWCEKRSVGALSLVNDKVVRDPKKCIGCGVCVVYCPTRAWTRSKEHYFRLTLLGRTGKVNPRMGEDFLKWVDEDSIVKIIKNSYAYCGKYINRDVPDGKEHIGYIVDRTGFEEFKKWILQDVEFSDKVEMNENIYWGGKRYDRW